MNGRRPGVVMLRRSKSLYLICVDILLTAGLRLTTKVDHNGIRIQAQAGATTAAPYPVAARRSRSAVCGDSPGGT